MTARGRRARNWVFTINNYIQQDVERVKELEFNDETFRLIAEEETAPTTGTKHIQGYVSFVNPCYRNTLETWLGGHAFVEQARGGWKQNFQYCSKENTVFVKKGENMGLQDEALSSTVTESALEAMKKMSTREFQDTYPSIWFYHRNKVMATMLDYSLRRVKNWTGELKDKNLWIWGEAGVGKSKWATSLAPFENTYKKNANKWWDGFSFLEHTLVIIEDYPAAPAGNLLANHMKLWGDRYPFIGEVKGGSINIQPGRFNLVVTSNFPIDHCFLLTEDIEAVKRRFNEIWVKRDNTILLQSMVPNRDLLDH